MTYCIVIDWENLILGGFHSAQQAADFCSQAVVIASLEAARKAGAPARLEIITRAELENRLLDLYGIDPQTGTAAHPPMPPQDVEARF